MSKNQRLELTWIGKENQPKLEPRILIEDPEKSYGDKNSENMLIYGDNLLALKALEQDYAGKIKCVCIDPPFNTGNAFEHYDDGLEHSLWLGLMRDRLQILKNLLCSDGVILLHLDDSEVAYAKVLMDEIFGRNNYLNTITMTTNAPSGFKATSSFMFSTANYMLMYAKAKYSTAINKIYIEKKYDTSYSKVLLNREDHYSKWKWISIAEAVAKEEGLADARKAKNKLGKDKFDKLIAEYAIKNAKNVFRTAAIGGGAKIKRQETISKSQKVRNKVFVHPNEDISDFYILNGEGIVFYDDRLYEIDGKLLPGQVLTDVWIDISWTGIANEGSVQFKNGKKPELLIKRCVELTTKPGDIVLDSFLGSGTTAAVAHKMGRRWIGIELGEHCHTHCLPRLKMVADGSDQGGISKSVNWKGGGGFKYYYLAPSLLKEDEHGNWVIDERYNADMLAAAMAKHEGFKYSPDEEIYWKQGQSTEKDFIFTTTRFVTVETLDKIREEMKPGESLLICCKSFQKACENQYSEITVKKIPGMLLGRCEFGREDYSFTIVAMPVDPDVPDFVPPGPGKETTGKKKKSAMEQEELF